MREEAMTPSDLQREMDLQQAELDKSKVSAPKPGEPLNPVGEAFEAGKRKRAKQRVLTAEIVETKLIGNGSTEPPQNEEPPRVKSALEEIAERSED